METFKELATEWNNVMPFKIKESDLQFPNEALLTNIILHYLEPFGFNITKLRECQQSENMEVRHKFKVDLCTYINHLYKLGKLDISQSFTYCDLIHPTPKKTYHVLKYLLNYLLFFNMMKKDVIEPTKRKIQECDEIINKTNCNEAKFQAAKIKKENTNDLVTKYKREIPKLLEKEKLLRAKEHDQIKKKEQLQILLRGNEACLITLKECKLRLNAEIITNEEAEAIADKKKAIEKELEEQSEIELANLEGNRQRKIVLNKLKEFIKHVENVIENSLLEDIDKYCSILKSESDLNGAATLLKNKNDQSKVIIEKNLKGIKNRKAVLKEKESKLKNIAIESQEKINTLEKNIEEREKNNEVIDLKLHDIENSLMEEEEIESIIKKSKDILFELLQEKDPLSFPNDFKEFFLKL